MITKGEITAIDFNGNTCRVHVPYFDGAVGGDPFIQEAVIINPPGIYNGYKVGDIVEVGFEDYKYSKVIVLGKLYLGAQYETENRGAINCQSLVTESSTEIPIGTKLISNEKENTVNLAGGYTDYYSLNELIDILQKLEQRMNGLETRLATAVPNNNEESNSST